MGQPHIVSVLGREERRRGSNLLLQGSLNMYPFTALGDDILFSHENVGSAVKLDVFEPETHREVARLENGRVRIQNLCRIDAGRRPHAVAFWHGRTNKRLPTLVRSD